MICRGGEDGGPGWGEGGGGWGEEALCATLV